MVGGGLWSRIKQVLRQGVRERKWDMFNGQNGGNCGWGGPMGRV